MEMLIVNRRVTGTTLQYTEPWNSFITGGGYKVCTDWIHRPSVDMPRHSDIAQKTTRNKGNSHVLINSNFWSNDKQLEAKNIHDPIGYTFSAIPL